MRPMLPVIFSLQLLLLSCGKHEQVSFGKEGITNIIQIESAEVLSQKIMDEDVAFIDKYLKAGGSVEKEFKTGRTLLTEACFWSKFKVIEFLTKNRADIHFKDQSGKSAIDYAEGNNKIKRILFPELTVVLKKTLFNQVKKNALNEMKKTLEENPPLNFYLNSSEWGEDIGESEGETLLTFSIKNKLEGVIRLLAQPKYELDSNLRNKNGESPLFLAKKYSLKNTEKILLKLGALE